MASPDLRCVPGAPRDTIRNPETIGPAPRIVTGGNSVESAISTQPFDDVFPIHPVSPGPRRWGHLEELRKIGQGVFGDVYRAWDALLEREVALKLYREARQRFSEWTGFGLQEARSLARIRHPNVVTVYGVDYREGRLGVWMEYIRGRTLEDLLREQGPLAAPEAALIGFNLCSAVSAVHELGMLHRDIQSKNVMVEDCGRIVLMDFGLSQDLHSSGRYSTPRVCGTPLYMAPEVLRGELASMHSDIYSMGVLLYHLVTGSFPVKAASLKEVRVKHERGETTPLRHRLPDVPQPYLCVVERSLSPCPRERFATARQLADALRTAFGPSWAATSQFGR
jgi:serine/threonine-protein kinase